MKKRVFNVFFALSSIILGWYLIARIVGKPTIFPTPSVMVGVVLHKTDWFLLFSDIFASLKRVAIGFLFASLLGVGGGLVLGLSRSLGEIGNIIVDYFRSIPPIARIPIVIIRFGIGEMSSYFLVFIGAFFPIFTNTYAGVHNVDPLHTMVAYSYQLTKAEFLRKVVLPSALPSIFSGLTIGAGIARMCVIIAEMIAASNGLGYMIQINRLMVNTPQVILGMICIGCIGFVMNKLIIGFGRWLMPRHVLYLKKHDDN